MTDSVALSGAEQLTRMNVVFEPNWMITLR